MSSIDQPDGLGSEPKRFTSSASTFALALAIAVLSWIAFSPGFGNPDTVAQLDQVRGGAITDWYAPELIYFARQFRVLDSYSAAFAVQNLFFGLAIAFILPKSWKIARRATVSVILILFPPIFGYVPALTRDSLFTWVTLLLFAVIFRLRSYSRLATLSVVLLSVLALMCRQNAVAVVLISTFAFLSRRRPLWRWWRRVAVSIGFVTCVLIAQMLIRKVVIHPVRLHPQQATQYFDLQSMSRKSGKVLLPTSAFPSQDLAVLNDTGKSYTSDFLFVAGNVTFPIEGSGYTELASRWKKELRGRPLLYLEVRLHYWSRQIGFGAPPIWIFEPGVPTNSMGARVAHPLVLKRFTEYMNNFAVNNISWGSPIFRSVFYYPLIVASLVWRRKRKLGSDESWRLASCLWAAGFVNELSLLFTAPGSNYRYSYLSIVFYCCGLCLAFFARTEPQASDIPGAVRI